MSSWSDERRVGPYFMHTFPYQYNRRLTGSVGVAGVNRRCEYGEERNDRRRDSNQRCSERSEAESGENETAKGLSATIWDLPSYVSFRLAVPPQSSVQSCNLGSIICTYLREHADCKKEINLQIPQTLPRLVQSPFPTPTG